MKCILGFHRKCVWYITLKQLYKDMCEEYYKKKREDPDTENIDVCDLLALPFSRDWLMYYCDRCIKAEYAKRFSKRSGKLSTVNTL